MTSSPSSALLGIILFVLPFFITIIYSRLLSESSVSLNSPHPGNQHSLRYVIFVKSDDIGLIFSDFTTASQMQSVIDRNESFKGIALLMICIFLSRTLKMYCLRPNFLTTQLDLK